MATQPKLDVGVDYKEKYGFFFPEDYVFKAKRGLTEEIVKEISFMKGEPEWMTKFRLRSLEIFRKKPMPTWGADLSVIDFENIFYYLRPAEKQSKSWEELPPDIKATYDRLGVPEAERKFLAGVSAQYESEVVYHSLQEKLTKQGVIFLDTDSALREHPDLFKEYFGTVIPPADNKFSALNSAVWSGGSFIYVPKGVKVDIPLQAYFRINAENMGQFERTLIICDEDSYTHYIEGCTAPIYTTDSLHSAVVEIIVKKGARCRYTTIQNWSTNVFNLVTKRAMAYQDATMEWVDGNLGCLAAGSRVFTNNDVKSIEDVKVGDFVYSLTPDFTWVRQAVTATKANPARPTWKLTTADHREVVATDNHPFLVLRKQGRLRQVSWMPLADIRIGDEIAISGLIPDHGRPYEIPALKTVGRTQIRIPRATDPELMWLLGFYLGDGTKERGRVIFCVPENDKSYERVRHSMRDIFGLEGKHHMHAQLRYASTDLSSFIEQLGFGGTAVSKRLPEWVYTLPVDQKRALIDGYIAADGHMRANHVNLSITSASRVLLEDIKALALTAGLNPLKVSTWTRRELKPLGIEEKEYTHHYLYFGERNPDAPVYFSPVMSIEDAGEQLTYDIEVEGTANFIANGVVAHNSQITMKYPSVYLMEPGAKGDVLSIAFAGKGQHQDAGGKMIHVAPNTTSTITSKSISKAGGRTSYRGHVKIYPGANNCKSFVKCDALLLDDNSRSDTYPYNDVDAENVTLGHEATVSKVSDEQLFYLMSRGIPRAEAETMIVNGFIEPFTKELPLEYAVELNRLIQLEMEGSVG
jgi:Fe-S cluster assembly scaffold protein SufB